jgi:hypothetical protein
VKTTHALTAAAFLLLAAGTSAAEIFRCTARDNRVTYQQEPCPDAALGGAVSIPASYPDYSAERDRLMQREAAMDARLLKRLEIEAAERIARDERVARELAAKAERERAESAPTYIVAWPARAPRHPPRRPWPAGIR